MAELFRSMIHFQLSIYRYIPIHILDYIDSKYSLIHCHFFIHIYPYIMFIHICKYYIYIYIIIYIIIYICIHPYYVCVFLCMSNCQLLGAPEEFFPGSGRVGKLILQAAAPNLTPATWRPAWRDF